MVINIKADGTIEDSFSTWDEHTHVHRQETLFWNSLGGGPWLLRFSSLRGSPLLEDYGMEDITVPKNGSAKGRSERFTVSTLADFGEPYPYRVREFAAVHTEPTAPGPELIVEGGGPLVKPKPPGGKTARRKTAPRNTVARKKTARKTTVRKAVTRKTAARKAVARKPAGRKATKAKATKRAAKKR